MVLPNELNITKAEHGESRIDMLDDGFSCDVYGYLEGDLVLSFIGFFGSRRSLRIPIPQRTIRQDHSRKN